eukprot:3530058-Rhodomonas_salina.6
MSGTDLALLLYLPTQCPALSAYAPHTRCPELTYAYGANSVPEVLKPDSRGQSARDRPESNPRPRFQYTL